MDLQRIVELASAATTHCFLFGGSALAAWTRRHKNLATGCCEMTGSDWYLVLHRSLDPARRPDLWTLNQWPYLKVVPVSFDVPPGSVDLSWRQPLVDDDSTAHLNALELRLSHERERLGRATSESERAIRQAWVHQVERELAGELAFLSVDKRIPVEMSDDALIAALMATDGASAT